MAEPTQNQPQGEKEEKFSIFKDIKYIPNFMWNLFSRLPIVTWFRPGRIKPSPKRKHPLENELRKTWLRKNDDMFVGMLQGIELTWGKHGHLVGFGNKKAGEDPLILGNPRGIAALYGDPETGLGVYSDIDRIESEAHWFQFGTGFKEEDSPYEFPNEKEWIEWGWDPVQVAKLKRDPTQPWKTSTLRQIRLEPGVIFHEAKSELREELYTFGFPIIRGYGASLSSYITNVVLQRMRQKKVQVFIRTEFTDALGKAFTPLFTTIADIEKENYDMLSGFTSKIQTYEQLYDELLDLLVPERVGILIRFPHTYRVIKIYYHHKIEKEKAKKVNEDGEIYEEEINSIKTVYFNPDKNDYKTRLEDLKRQIDNLGGEAELTRQADKLLRQARRYKDEIISVDTNLKALYSKAIKENFSRILLTNIFQELGYKIGDKEERDFLEEFKQRILVILRLLNRQPVSASNYDSKLNELLDFITAKFREFSLKIDDPTRRYFDETLSALKKANDPKIAVQYKIEEKGPILKDLYTKIVALIKTHVAAKTALLGELSTKINNKLPELADSEKEVEDIEKAVIDFCVDVLLEKMAITKEEDVLLIKKQLDEKELKEITDEKTRKIKKYSENLEKGFNVATSTKGLNKLQKLKASIEATRLDFLAKRREILRYLFEKEQLEFYNEILPTKNPRFKRRTEEFDYGLDENGYPLEIDPHHHGIVLIDKWWREIAQNKWQLETIGTKPGGKYVLERHLGLREGLHYTITGDINKPKVDENSWNLPSLDEMRPQRYVDDDRFHGNVDLLDAGTMIFSTWDAVRDDFRDGRYHNHSKSVGDYTIEGMGGFDENYGAPYIRNFAQLSREKGLYITRRGTIHSPKKSAASKVKIDDPNEWIKAKPSDFGDSKVVPNDELSVTRKFRMRIPEEALNQPGFSARNSLHKIEKTPYGTFWVDERIPTKYNPAFDRRAADFKYMHWGCMYYYEWSYNANIWSENPFPHISTRGIALYIQFLAASDVWYYKEGEELLEDHKFDYGVRGQGEFGNVNPLSGTGTNQEN